MYGFCLGRQMSALSISSNPERAAEEGRVMPKEFSPSNIKPMNYPVGKPLEVSWNTFTETHKF